MKICLSCKTPKRLSEFNIDRSRKDGKQVFCKECRNVKCTSYRKKNKMKVAVSLKKWFNSEKGIAYRRSRIESGVIAQIQKQRIDTDINYRLRQRLGVRIWNALKAKGVRKLYKTEQLIGCTIKELKQHLESQFKEGMSWGNYGKWHVDHKLPCVSFDLSKQKEQKKCFHYSNLQPLWQLDNIRKGGRLSFT